MKSKSESNRNVASWFSKVVDMSQIVNKTGIDEEKLDSMLTILKNEVITVIGENATAMRDESNAIKKAIDQKFCGAVCDIKANFDFTLERLKNCIENKIIELRDEHTTFVEEIKKDYASLSNTVVKIEDCFLRLADRYSWENNNISNVIIKKITDNRNIEFQTGKECLLTAKFDEARINFQRVIDAGTEDLRAEAYFCLALAECKIQPIWDYSRDTVLPICYQYYENFKENVNYKNAIQYFNGGKNVVEPFVKEIDATLKSYRDLQNKNKKYDCFICLKVSETNDTGNNTEDCVWLKNSGLYDRLNNNEEITTFCSEMDCKDISKGTAYYNAQIQYALSTAKVMILICSNEDYLHTAWVKNEYSRFRYLLRERGESEENIIIVFKDKAINLPHRLQFEDYDRNRGVDDLIKLLKKRLNDAKNYIMPNYKYCSNCGERYSFDTQGVSCLRCKGSIVDPVTYLNRLIEKEGHDKNKLTEALEKKKEQLKEKDKSIEQLKIKLSKIEKDKGNLQNKNTDVSPSSNFIIEKNILKKYVGNEIEVNIPNEIKEIGAYAFSGCNSLKKLIMPNSVKQIKNGAFAGCINLEDLVVSKNLTEIGFHVFEDCLIKKVVIPSNFIHFLTKDKLKEVIVTGNNIGIDAFKGCSLLTSITISDGVKSIGVNAFKDCSSLTNITIPDSVTSIGVDAFSGCSSLTNIAIPDSVTWIGRNAFNSCTGIIQTINEVQYVDKWVIGCGKTVTNASIESGTKGIANKAFEGCSSLTDITIPDSVTSIGEYAFKDCSSLTNITIPDGVTRIGDNAFALCRSLTGITIPNGVTSIGNTAFYGCNSLTDITIPNSVLSIGLRAFALCRSLTSITIPDGVTKIGYGTFQNCSSLKSIILPNSVERIEGCAFSGCSNVTDVYIGSGVKFIGSDAFNNHEITSIKVHPDNQKFAGINNCLICKANKKLILGCKNSIVPEDGSVTSISAKAFSYCKGLREIKIPDTIRSIAGESFCDTGLEEVIIPYGVQTIGKKAFYDCASLTSVTMPNSVTAMGDYVFAYCRNLKKIKFEGTLEQWKKIERGHYWNTDIFSRSTLVLECKDGTQMV